MPDTLEDAHRVIGLLWGELKDMASRVEKLSAEVARQAAPIEELEERLKHDSSNSSKPPSQDRMKGRPDQGKRKSSGRKKGGQPGHVHNVRELAPETEMDAIAQIQLPSATIFNPLIPAAFPHGTLGGAS